MAKQANSKFKPFGTTIEHWLPALCHALNQNAAQGHCRRVSALLTSYSGLLCMWMRVLRFRSGARGFHLLED